MSRYLTNRNKGLFLIIFAVLYFVFTALVVGHGVHILNSIVTVGMVGVGVYLLGNRS